jgi:hypothetical protein
VEVKGQDRAEMRRGGWFVYLSKLKRLEIMLGRDGVRRCVQETYSSKAVQSLIWTYFRSE